MTERKLLVAAFETEAALLKATRDAREQGHRIHDAYTPYPVHGLDAAMGLRTSVLPRLCFLFGMTGLLVAILFQTWVGLIDWPMNIGGKSFGAGPALVPVAFELTVLFAGLGSVASFLLLSRLFPGREPQCADFGASNDRFVLALYDPESHALTGSATRLLKEHGADKVEEVTLKC